MKCQEVDKLSIFKTNVKQNITCILENIKNL